jgi:tRNA(Phe) wybutosine-synthesizing methylase Tyw3
MTWPITCATQSRCSGRQEIPVDWVAVAPRPAWLEPSESRDRTTSMGARLLGRSHHRAIKPYSSLSQLINRTRTNIWRKEQP